MQLIDFDAHFQDALNEWIRHNKGKHRHADELEAAAMQYYSTWLETPAPWLDGVAPGQYFAAQSDAYALVALLRRYVEEGVPVPDLLADRIAELPSEAPLLTLVRDEAAPCEARMYAVDLLRQLESAAPMVDYLRWQVERTQDDDMRDNALDSLRCMGEAVRRPAKLAFQAAGDEGKEALLDVLADFPGDEDVVAFAIRRFKALPERRALYAGYLGKLGDERALEPLLNVAEGEKIGYVDFIEIRNAIERLGGEAPERDFSADPEYRAIKRRQKH